MTSWWRVVLMFLMALGATACNQDGLPGPGQPVEDCFDKGVCSKPDEVCMCGNNGGCTFNQHAYCVKAGGDDPCDLDDKCAAPKRCVGCALMGVRGPSHRASRRRLPLPRQDLPVERGRPKGRLEKKTRRSRVRSPGECF